MATFALNSLSSIIVPSFEVEGGDLEIKFDHVKVAFVASNNGRMYLYQLSEEEIEYLSNKGIATNEGHIMVHS